MQTSLVTDELPAPKHNVPMLVFTAPRRAAVTEKPYGEIMDEMDHEAKYLSADNILQDIIVTMRHARAFITSREKMHPTGVQLYDELLEKLVRRTGVGGASNG
jgi:hypothetical protein